MDAPMNAAEAVANGASLLDENYPGWHRLIDLDQLTLASCTDCICGQLGQRLLYTTESYGPMLKRLGISGRGDLYGFDVRFHVDWNGRVEHVTTFGDLDEEWRQAINVRREMDKLSPVPASEPERAIEIV